jgi:hypothetical protein
VYAAARDLPAGTPLRSGDLTVVRVRLPDSALRHYLRPGPDRAVAGRVLTAPVRRKTLVPAELALASQQADLVELPVQADPGDMAAAIATARIFVVKAPGPPTGQAALPPPAPSDPQAPPPGTTQPGDDPSDSSPSDTSPADTSTASPAEAKR